MGNNIELLNKTSLLISGLKLHLESISKNSESRFVKLGQDLQCVYSDAESLARSAIDAASLIKGDSGDNLLSNIGTFAKESLGKLERFKSGVSDIFPRFESCLTYIKKLNATCPGIIKIAKTLNMIAFNISTESSRTKSAEELFGIFVKEIKELVKKVSDISNRIKDDTENSKSNQENEFKNILYRMDQLEETSDNARDIVFENIRRIDEVMSLSLVALNQSEIHSQKISGLVSEVVVAIQFHDIVRQQIEHVIEGLQDLDASIRGKETLQDEEKNNLSQLGNAYHMLNLQTLQTKQIIVEIKDAHAKIAAAFENIGNEIEALVNGVGRIGGGEQDNAFNLLLSGLEKLETTMGNGEGVARQIEDAMKQTSASTSDISDYLSSMQDISTELHIKSINALIMSKKLGSNGVALSVLAQYVTEVSKGSDDFVSEVIDILRSIQTSAKDLNDISSKMNDGSGYGDKKDATLGNGIGAISLIYDRFTKNTELSRQGSILLKKKISEVGSELIFLAEMKNNLEGCRKKMDEMVKELSPFSSYSQKATAAHSRLQSRYTMEIERGIHRRSIGKEEGMIKEAQAGESDLGDNVELF